MESLVVGGECSGIAGNDLLANLAVKLDFRGDLLEPDICVAVAAEVMLFLFWLESRNWR